MKIQYNCRLLRFFLFLHFLHFPLPLMIIQVVQRSARSNLWGSFTAVLFQTAAEKQQLVFMSPVSDSYHKMTQVGKHTLHIENRLWTLFKKLNNLQKERLFSCLSGGFSGGRGGSRDLLTSSHPLGGSGGHIGCSNCGVGGFHDLYRVIVITGGFLMVSLILEKSLRRFYVSFLGSL